MALPQPEIGLIIHYSYVFHARTKNIGKAGKDRPCVIAAIFQDKDDAKKTGVLYLPITHADPGPDEVAVEIPPNTRFAAGLDGSRQWLLVSQGNQDIWPEDVFNLPSQPGVFHYGHLPPRFYRNIQQEFAKVYAARKFNVVVRG